MPRQMYGLEKNIRSLVWEIDGTLNKVFNIEKIGGKIETIFLLLNRFYGGKRKVFY